MQWMEVRSPESIVVSLFAYSTWTARRRTVVPLLPRRRASAASARARCQPAQSPITSGLACGVRRSASAHMRASYSGTKRVPFPICVTSCTPPGQQHGIFAAAAVLVLVYVYRLAGGRARWPQLQRRDDDGGRWGAARERERERGPPAKADAATAAAAGTVADALPAVTVRRVVGARGPPLGAVPGPRARASAALCACDMGRGATRASCSCVPGLVWYASVQARILTGRLGYPNAYCCE